MCAAYCDLRATHGEAQKVSQQVQRRAILFYTGAACLGFVGMPVAESCDRALVDLHSALVLEPDHAIALLQLDTAYEKLGCSMLIILSAP